MYRSFRKPILILNSRILFIFVKKKTVINKKRRNLIVE